MSLPCFKSFSGSQNATLPSFSGLTSGIFSQCRCSQPGHFRPLKGHWPMCGDIFGCHSWGWGREILLNTSKTEDSLSLQRITWSKHQQCQDWEILLQPHQTMLFSTHVRLSHMLLCLYIGCFLYLECPTLLLCPRNDHVWYRIQLKMSPPLYSPIQIPQSWVSLLCFHSFWYMPHTSHSAPKSSVACWR